MSIEGVKATMNMRKRWLQSPHSRNWLVLISALLCILLVGIVPVSAQATPIDVGENKSGEISAASPAEEFTLTAPVLQSARVQVLAITPGLAPFFTVIDATNGIPVLDVGVNGQATIVQGDLTLAANVTYIIQVQSANGVFGQFVISVQQGPPIQPPRPLTTGQPISQAVSRSNRSFQYSFAADPTEILLLNVHSENNEAGPNVVLRDAVTGQTLAASSTRLIGVRFRIPVGAQTFFAEVTHSGAVEDENYIICLETESSAVTCPLLGDAAVAPTPTPAPTETPLPTVPGFTPAPINPGGPCSLAPAGASPVNVRSGPSTSFSIVTQLGANTIVPVTGRIADNTWYQVNVGGIPGWVSATVARIGGNCATVTIITFPTATPTITPTSPATATTTATATPTPTLTSTLTPTATETVAPVATLNLSLPPVYGSTSLTSGFVPDPFSVGVTGGGPANASYLGGGCTGYTTSAPSFSVNYTSGAFPTLRFYFIGSGDTTMIINTPSGSYVCVDDSFGTLNPTIDFNSPSSGRYDVWVASYAQGASIGGTLYVTENTGSHP